MVINDKIKTADGYLPGPSDQVNTIVRALQSHPGIREAAAFQRDQFVWMALIEANDSYLDEVLERKKARDLALTRWRKSFDLTQFTRSAASNPIGLNIQGWNSSYTGGELPIDEMQEWVQNTVAEILGFLPKAVYEIGCGTGMLLMRVGPACDRYAAADFSLATLDKLRTQLGTLPDLERLVELFHRTADDFSGFAPDSFDTVVINSVAQYFPSAAYLSQVLEGAIRIVKPGGRIFVGDVQSLPLELLFATSVELFRAEEALSVSQLRKRIERRINLDPWLFISPAYFVYLPTRYRKVSRIEIKPRAGRANNEVTRYRYNAILHVGRTADHTQECVFDDWRENEWSVDDIRAMLHDRQVPFGIAYIPNSRVQPDAIAAGLLSSADSEMPIWKLRAMCAAASVQGIHPEDLVDLANENPGIEARLSWAAGRHDGSFDVAFVPATHKGQRETEAIPWPQPDRSECTSLTSWPGQARLKAELLDRVLAHCKDRLPPNLVPTELKLVDLIPRDEQGGLDFHAILDFKSL